MESSVSHTPVETVKTVSHLPLLFQIFGFVIDKFRTWLWKEISSLGWGSFQFLPGIGESWSGWGGLLTLHLEAVLGLSAIEESFRRLTGFGLT